MLDVIDATALITAAAVAALIVTLTVHAADSRRDPHRYDASRCPNQDQDQDQGEEMNIPLNSIAAILMRIAALEGRLTVLELRMYDHDRHDGDDALDDGDDPDRYTPCTDMDTDFATRRETLT